MNAITEFGTRYALAAPVDPVLLKEMTTNWWPIGRIGEAMDELSRRHGLKTLDADASEFPHTQPQHSLELLGEWVQWAARRAGFEAERIETVLPELEDMLRGCAPALIPYETAQGLGVFVLLGSQSGALRLLSPDLKVQSCDLEKMRALVCWEFEAPITPEIDRLLHASKIDARRHASIRSAMLRERTASNRIGPCWMLRLPAGASFRQQLLDAGIGKRIAILLALFGVIYGLELAGWSLLGNATLSGHYSLGWMQAWALLLFTVVPLKLAGSWIDSNIALDTGRLLKSRLLVGALGMDPEKVKAQGVGHLLGRVIESQALEALALNGGIAVLVCLLELLFAAAVLWMGAAAGLHLVLLGVWLCLGIALSTRYFRHLQDWTLTRLALTHGLIERMTGHRTRLAQEHPGRRDFSDDEETHSYLQKSASMDRALVPVLVAIPSGWLIMALFALLPAFASPAAPSVASLAISIGGILLAQRALSGTCNGLAALARAGISWKQVAEIFHAGKARPVTQRFISPENAKPSPGERLIEANAINFSYSKDGKRILSDLDVEIRHGERILLQGASGGGKSTLASVLAGLRLPSSGLLLLNGLDRHTLGDAWHQAVSEAPQFHENHILSGPFAFNLLMGRQWPASEADLQEAQDLCEELGLGDLLRKMPAGILQQVGETGWQLSHGERSRVYLARALLQNAQLTILDESFAALDPQTLKLCMECCLRRARTLIVIAHP